VDPRRGIGDRVIFAIVRGQMLWGIVLIIVGLLVGPGGVSVFT